MSVSFLELWLGNVMFGTIVVAIYSRPDVCKVNSK